MKKREYNLSFSQSGKIAPKKFISKKTLILFLSLVLSMTFFSLDYTGSREPGSMSSLNFPRYCPAKPGPTEVTQPDGTSLTIEMVGDEFCHYIKSVDGYTLFQDPTGEYYYAKHSPQNHLINSGVRAFNPGQRSQSELRFLKKIQKHLTYSPAQITKAEFSRGENLPGLFRTQFAGVDSTFPSTGNHKLLVILVNFTDESFVKSTGDVDTLMNGAAGSFRKYILDNSYNQLNITSDIVGPYNLSGDMATYGAQDGATRDIDPWAMVAEAVDLAEGDGVDFSQYDNDSNGSVDGIMVIHAGYGQEYGGVTSDAIWSHRWDLWTDERNYDGVTISDYTTVPELGGNSGATISGIGIIAHEFGHNLGLPDYYDVDGSGSGGESGGTGKWDVMSSGSWNDDGYTPPQHSSYSKWLLGWITPTQLTAATTITVNDSSINQDAYYFESSVSGELFIVENRQQTGWDAFLPGHGLIIHHVDENYWNGDGYWNNVNCDPDHQGYDIEEADNHEDWGDAGDSFPGTSNKTSFTDTTTPNAKAWDNSNTGKPISNIAENGGVITFDYMGGGGVPGGYCSASHDYAYGIEMITRVQVGSIDKSSAWAAYSDFTSESTDMQIGTGYPFTATVNDSWDTGSKFAVWIDWNKDEDFDDAGEEVYNYTGVGNYSTTITPPAGASLGTTRMRVRMFWAVTPTPCGDLLSGEVEDYSINVTSGTPQAPAADFTASATSIDVGDSVTFTDTSSNNPTSWSWTFNGGTPSSSTTQNPIITYNSAGTYTVSLTATNAVGGDTETKVDYITVSEATEVVTILKAEWKSARQELTVEATSSEQPNATLTVVGFGTMTYLANRNKYELKIRPVGNPGTVTVTSSQGGSDTKTVTIR
jgi:M6 family metalloprotease-like protein